MAQKISSITIDDPQPHPPPSPFTVLISFTDGTDLTGLNLTLQNDDYFSKQNMLNLARDAVVNNLDVEFSRHQEQDPRFPNDPSRTIDVLDSISIFNPHNP